MHTPASKHAIHARRAIPLAAAGCALLLGACGSSSVPHGAAADDHAVGIEFSTCMRSHGVPGFPDPEADSGVQIPLSLSTDPSPAFTSAIHACGHLIPTGAPPVVPASQQEAALRFAQCIRRHGVPSFPDPVYRDGHQIPIPASADNAVSLASPAFKAAVAACRTA
jgi:hypothetical protein